MKHVSLKLMLAAIVMSLTMQLTSCKSKPKDADLLASVNAKFSSDPRFANVNASVTAGVLTLTGQCPDESCKTSAEERAREVKEISSVTNNIAVVSPVPQAPVVVATDNALETGVKDAVKDFPGVQAEVSDGEINLTGNIKRSELQKLMRSLNALKAKKINNKLTIN
ncbi:MAG: BON domain-containing protein [Chitinophagaceae bacterium]